MRTPRLPAVDWTDAPADLNGLVLFADGRNLVSTRVPSHINWPLLFPYEGKSNALRADLFHPSVHLLALSDHRPNRLSNIRENQQKKSSAQKFVEQV